MAVGAEAFHMSLPPGVIPPEQGRITSFPTTEQFIADYQREAARRPARREPISPTFCRAFSVALADNELAQPLAILDEAIVALEEERISTDETTARRIDALHANNTRLHVLFFNLQTQQTNAVECLGVGWNFDFEPQEQNALPRLEPGSIELAPEKTDPFIHAVMHNVRTPISAIAGTSQLLLLCPQSSREAVLSEADKITQAAQVVTAKMTEIELAPALAVNITHDGAAHLFIPLAQAA